ncbi:MAG: type 4a pilus biogenesis protein PilO [Gammaproteobacteria bacterium]
MNSILSQVDYRTFLLSVVGFVSIVIIGLLTYALKPELKEYNSINSDLVKLERIVKTDNNVASSLDKLSQEVESVKYKIKGDMVNLPEKEMEAYILGVLQNISWNHDIKLIGVKPSQGNEIHIFQEILFDVKLSGNYFDLYQWFLALREDLGFIVIKNMNLSPSKTDGAEVPLLMDLTIATYKSIK